MVKWSGVCCTNVFVTGVSLLDGRTGEECEAMSEAASTEHPDHHAAHLALRWEWVVHSVRCVPVERTQLYLTTFHLFCFNSSNLFSLALNSTFSFKTNQKWHNSVQFNFMSVPWCGGHSSVQEIPHFYLTWVSALYSKITVWSILNQLNPGHTLFLCNAFWYCPCMYT